MNILQVRSEFWDNGPGTQSLEIAKELRRRGHKVIFASSGGVLAQEMEEKYGFSHILIPTLSRLKRDPISSIKNIMELRKLIVEESIQIIHGHNAAATYLGYLASLGLGRKVGITQSVRGMEIRKMYQWRNWIYRINPAEYLAVSNYTKQMLLQAGVSADAVTVSYNGVDVSRFHRGVDGGRIREELGISPGTKVVTVVGKMSGAKGQEVLVQTIPAIIENYDNVMFLFVGDGPILTKCKELAQTYGINKHVRFLGFRRDIPEIQAGSDIFVLPSIKGEMFPNAILEAMSMGKPWVASNLAGIPEMSENSTTGFVVAPGNVEQLTEKILLLLKDDSLAKQMGEQGERVVNERYLIRHVVDRIEAVYHRSLR